MEYNPIAKQFEDNVLSGAFPSGRLLRLAIERQRNDLEHGHERGLYFDHEAGQNILDFAELVNIAPETPIVLHPSQVWELYVFYGWNREDGRRRFRFKYKSCARGNGKTPLESLQILYHLVVDGPFKAEAYVSATKEDQAKIAFNDAKNMLEFSPELQEDLEASAERIFNRSNKAVFGFLTSNPKTADGKRPTYAVVDEYHEFDNDDMIVKLKTGLIKTPNPILNIVTTRGTDKTKPCFKAEDKFYIPVVEGVIEHDATFVLIYSLDKEDIESPKNSKAPAPWRNPKVWGKASPMLGHLIRMDDMAEALDEAEKKGAVELAGFKTLNLNMWVDAAEVWIEDEVWLRSGSEIDLQSLSGRTCYGGLDLAKRDDFCSLCLLFPEREEITWEEVLEEDISEEKQKKPRSMFDGWGEMAKPTEKVKMRLKIKTYFTALWWHWIPADTIQRRIDNGLSDLRAWVDEGYVIKTEGEITDYDVVESTIERLASHFQIETIGYDAHNIGNLATNLTNYGLTMNVMPQTMPVLSEPTKQYEYAVRQARLNHGFDPVMRWQMKNAVVIKDNNENIRITKDHKRAKDKVDGVIAAIIAMGEYITNAGNTTSNIYDERGFIEL